jgi:ABC-2 type transport system ATP-binding protein
MKVRLPSSPSGRAPAHAPRVLSERTLRISSLRRDFDGRTVLDKFDLDLARGERVALLGPNGSGKSTVLRCVAGTVTPTEGRIDVLGHRAGTLRARQLVGVSLAQERSFDLRLTGRANLLLFARLRGSSVRSAARSVDALEDELELAEITRQWVAKCSTGMTQQLAFARALLGDPPLVLLDEPTRSLDDDARGRLWAAIRRRPAIAVLIATHRPEDVAECDRSVRLGH